MVHGGQARALEYVSATSSLVASVACHQPRSAGSWSAIPPASVTLRRFFAPILILTPSQSSAASYSVGGSRQPFKRFASTWASRRNGSGPICHPAHNPGAARLIFPGGYLGAWADGGSKDRGSHPSSGMVGKSLPTFSDAIAAVRRAMDAAGFFHVPVSVRALWKFPRTC